MTEDAGPIPRLFAADLAVRSVLKLSVLAKYASGEFRYLHIFLGYYKMTGIRD
jgi:hypothetical protein